MQRPNDCLLDQCRRGLHRESDRPGREDRDQTVERAFDARFAVRLGREEFLAQGVKRRPKRRLAGARVERRGAAPEARPGRLEAPIGNRVVVILTSGRARSSAPLALSAIFEFRFHVSIARRFRALRKLLPPAF